jgi:hypothetical protein
MATAVVWIGGCTTGGADSAEGAREHTPPAATDTARAGDPPQTYIGPTGTRFRLVGRANTRPIGPDNNPQGFDAREKDVAARAVDPVEHDPTATPTLEQLAEDLRPVMLVGGQWEYRAEEPAYELAEAILNGDDIAPQSTEGREGRTLVGDACPGGAPGSHCDNRVIVNTPDAQINAPNLMSQGGCSATMIDRSTAVTAAHCFYNPDGWVGDPTPYWYVLDGISCRISSESGTPSSSPKTEDRRPDGATSTANCLPRWAAAMSPSGPRWSWLSCYNVTIPGAWTTATSNTYPQSIRHDYAVIDFNIFGCSNRNPGDTSGWRGTMVATADQLSANYTWLVGYPGWADPGGSNENGWDPAIWRYTPFMCAGASDLPGNADNSWAPCTTATMMGMSVYPGYAIDIWGLGTWNLGSTLMDASAGQSGAGVFLSISNPSGSTVTPPSSPQAQYLVGIHRGYFNGGLYNSGQISRRWDTTFRNFVISNTSFPRTTL